MREEPPYTASEVAKLFGVDRKTISRWEKRGLIRGFRTPGGHRRFHADDVAELIRRSRAR